MLDKRESIERTIERDAQGKFLRGHSGFRDNNNGMWKGEKAKYASVHEWIRRRLGEPSICSNCGTTTAKKYEWANISGQYNRNLSDWIRLCASCHRLKDGNGIKAWIARRRKANGINSQKGN